MPDIVIKTSQSQAPPPVDTMAARAAVAKPRAHVWLVPLIVAALVGAALYVLLT